MRKIRWLVLLAAVFALCCGGRRPAPGGAGLHDLSSLAELRAAFNADAGKPRIILLLSPT